MTRPTARGPFALVGVPYDGSSSFLRGAAGAPSAIRAALQSASSNAWSERGVDALALLEDAGDVRLPVEPPAAREAIERAVGAVLARGWRPLALGGDHSVTYPIVRAFAGRHERLTIVHFDAHGDLYDAFEGDRYSHACPFARIMEERLATRLVQIGVRTLNDHQRAQARAFGVEQFGMDRWEDAPLETLEGPLYVSLDLDVLDPAFAPGLSHPEPGGLSVREVVSLLHRIGGEVVGADVVEYNPECDVRDLTARVAAKLIKEMVAGGI
jgi:arginase